MLLCASQQEGLSRRESSMAHLSSFAGLLCLGRPAKMAYRNGFWGGWCGKIGRGSYRHGLSQRCCPDLI